MKKKIMEKMNVKVFSFVIGALLLISLVNACSDLSSEQPQEETSEVVQVDNSQKEKEKANAKKEMEEKRAQEALELQLSLAAINMDLQTAIAQDETGVFIDAMMEDYTFTVMFDGLAWAMTPEEEKHMAISILKNMGDDLRDSHGLSLIYTLRIIDERNTELAIMGLGGKIKIKR